MAFAVLSVASVAYGATGKLTHKFAQKPGIAGCVSEDGTAGVCANGVALDTPFDVVVSPDGTSAYVASRGDPFAAGGSDGVAIFDRDPSTGALTQKPGTAGCVSETGTFGECVNGVALFSPVDVAVSPDGTSVYIASYDSGAVAIFDRDPGTGALAQKPGTAGCVSKDGTGGECEDGVALDGASGVAVSPDGASVYVASAFSSAVAIFDRDPSTGALAQKPGTAGCVSEDGTFDQCEDGVALLDATDVAVSPDRASVYVTSFNGGVAIFDRDPSTGALTQKPGTAGCVSDHGTGGACQDGVALDGVEGVAVSPDGASVYVASYKMGAVAILDRDPGTGALAQKPGTAGCVSEDGTGGACQDGVALQLAADVAVSPGGASVYVASGFSNAVAIFDRVPSTGALAQAPGIAGCVSEHGTGGACQDGVALDGAIGVEASPDGASVYVASAGSNAVAIFDPDAPPDEPDPPPDTDGDGVPDAADSCPTQTGPAANGGCPEATDDDAGVPSGDGGGGNGACEEAKKKLKQAKRKLEKLKAEDAKANAIKKAKKKLKKAKKKKREACA